MRTAEISRFAATIRCCAPPPCAVAGRYDQPLRPATISLCEPPPSALTNRHDQLVELPEHRGHFYATYAVNWMQFHVHYKESTMSIEANVQTVKDFFAAIGSGDKKRLLALAAEDIEWIIPGKDWPLAGTRHGHAGLADLLETASRSIETSTEPREFIAQGDRVLVIGFATGKIKATNKTFEDDWIFAMTVREGKVTRIREYVDTQALARASQGDAGGPA